MGLAVLLPILVKVDKVVEQETHDVDHTKTSKLICRHGKDVKSELFSVQ